MIRHDIKIILRRFECKHRNFYTLCTILYTNTLLVGISQIHILFIFQSLFILQVDLK